jgi:hypothetical protein
MNLKFARESTYRKSGIPLGVEMPAPARIIIRLYRPVLIDSISLSTENDFTESFRTALGQEKSTK